MPKSPHTPGFCHKNTVASDETPYKGPSSRIHGTAPATLCGPKRPKPLVTTQPTMKKTIALLASITLGLNAFAAEDNPMKKAMSYAHKAPEGQKKIGEKICEGTATDEEASKTLSLYKAMLDCTPPRGEKAAYKEKMEKLIAATEAVVAKKDGAAAQYKEAVNCKACHSEHKPQKK